MTTSASLRVLGVPVGAKYEVVIEEKKGAYLTKSEPERACGKVFVIGARQSHCRGRFGDQAYEQNC